MDQSASKWKRATAVVAVLWLASAAPAGPAASTAPAGPRARNVIVLVMDGCSSAHLTLTRWYKGQPLALDEILVGGVRTYASNSLITDSAPAATAFATGHKTNDCYVGITPDETTMPHLPRLAEDQRNRPMANVLEAAKLSGRSVGLVATVNVQHATPAGFSAHWYDREDFNEIALQQVYLGLDVVIAGGWKYLVPRSGRIGTRSDGLNLLEVLRDRGYQFASSREEMAKIKDPKAWCLLAEDHLFCEFDRRVLFPDQPSLAEMTTKAINLLAQNPKGFFLMVEGSMIDWASHANDPIGVISELLSYDDAVAAALKFAKADGNTLVVAFADHGNGGLSIGKKLSPIQMLMGKYALTGVDELLDPLKKATLTGEGVEMALGGDYSDDNIRKTIAKYQGIQIDDEELAELHQARKYKMNMVLGPIFSKRTILGWTTSGHTGEDLFLYAYGPGKPTGLIENTQIATACAQAMGVDLKKTTDELFVPWPEVAAQAGLTLPPQPAQARSIWRWDRQSKLVVDRPGKGPIELIYSTDRIRVGDKEYRAGGVIIDAPLNGNGNVYVPKSAAAVLKEAIKEEATK